MRSIKTFAGGTCFLQVLFLVVYTVVAKFATEYCINVFFAVDVHWVLDVILGFFLGWASIILAIVLHILLKADVVQMGVFVSYIPIFFIPVKAKVLGFFKNLFKYDCFSNGK